MCVLGCVSLFLGEIHRGKVYVRTFGNGCLGNLVLGTFLSKLGSNGLQHGLEGVQPLGSD